MSSSAFRECDAEDDDDELLGEEEEEEEEEEKEETRKKLDAVLGKLRKHSERVRKDIRDILSLAKSHADAHAMSTKEHARLHSETTRVYCESVEKAVDSTDDLMQRVVSVAAFAAPLKALATRTRTLRMRAELLEKMCEEKGIITATPEKKGWNSGLSPLNAIGGGFSSLSPMRVFRSGSASPKKKNTPPASPSRKSKLNNDGPFAVTATKTKKEEEEEGKKENEKIIQTTQTSSSTTPKVPRPPLPPPPPQPPSSSSSASTTNTSSKHRQQNSIRSQTENSSSPTPFDPSNIIVSVVERKKIERLAELRENERVKEGKYGVVTPYENSPTETPRRKTSGEREKQDREEEDKDVASMDEVVHSLGQM